MFAMLELFSIFKPIEGGKMFTNQMMAYFLEVFDHKLKTSNSTQIPNPNDTVKAHLNIQFPGSFVNYIHKTKGYIDLNKKSGAYSITPKGYKLIRAS